MKLELIQKGDKFAIRDRWGFISIYLLYDGWWFCPDFTAWMDKEEALSTYNRIILSRQNNSKFKNSKSKIVKSNEY